MVDVISLNILTQREFGCRPPVHFLTSLAPLRGAGDGLHPGPEVEHSRVSCCGNPIEQDHRGIKQRYYTTLGLKNFDAAQRFCRVVDEVRNFLRPREWMGEKVSLAERREHFLKRVVELQGLVAPA